MRHALALLLMLAPLGAEAQAPASDEPGIVVTVDHAMSLEAAHGRIEELLAYWRERFAVEAHWQGESVRLRWIVEGREVVGRLEVRPRAVRAVLEDPGGLWRWRATTYVQRKLQKYLSPTYAEP
jgi:hypothetical protein